MTLNEFTKESGIKIVDLAKLLGCSRNTVYAYMSGKIKPSNEAEQRIFRATGGKVTPYDFFDTIE